MESLLKENKQDWPGKISHNGVSQVVLLPNEPSLQSYNYKRKSCLSTFFIVRLTIS